MDVRQDRTAATIVNHAAEVEIAQIFAAVR